MILTYYDYLMQIHKDKSSTERKKTIKRAQQKKRKFIEAFTKGSTLKSDYIDTALTKKHHKLLVFTLDNELSHSSNTIGMVFYHIMSRTKKYVRIYIHICAIREHARGCGYGTAMMNDLKTFLQSQHSNKTIEIYLLSIKETKTFYESCGFTDTSKYHIVEKKHEDEHPMECILRNHPTQHDNTLQNTKLI